jgi:hypothetical protein
MTGKKIKISLYILGYHYLIHVKKSGDFWNIFWISLIIGDFEFRKSLNLWPKINLNIAKFCKIEKKRNERTLAYREEIMHWCKIWAGTQLNVVSHMWNFTLCVHMMGTACSIKVIESKWVSCSRSGAFFRWKFVTMAISLLEITTTEKRSAFQVF